MTEPKLTSWARVMSSEKETIGAEQMDVEDLGRKLLLTNSGDPCRTPEKQPVGTVTASHKMLTLQALSSSLNAGTARRAAWAEERHLVPSGSPSPRTAASIYTSQRQAPKHPPHQTESELQKPLFWKTMFLSPSAFRGFLTKTAEN